MQTNNLKPEDLEQKNIPSQVPEKFGRKGFGRRAICLTNTTNSVLDLTPGQTLFQEISVKNGSHWPWKEGTFLGMDDPRQGDADVNTLPVTMVNVPVSQDVGAKETIKLSVPIKAIQ